MMPGTTPARLLTTPAATEIRSQSRSDIAQPEGRELILELAAKSDVFIENFKVGGLKRYGLGYEDVKKLNPSIIYCSITGFGQDGPYAERPGYDFLIQGMGGLMSLTGRPDGEPGAGPLKVGVALTDILTGMYSTVAILAALAHRDRTGEGQHIDLALLDVQVACLANQAMSYLATWRGTKTNGKCPSDRHAVSGLSYGRRVHDPCDRERQPVRQVQ